MRIESVETFTVPPEWLFVRVRTDEGLTGWGEAGAHQYARTVATAVGELAEYLVGRDPLSLEDHWQVLTKARFYRGGAILASAVAALDLALWDLAGKARGVPVHELLGGPVRDRMRVYAWIGAGDSGAYAPEELAREAADKVAEGFTAVKMIPSALTAVDTPARAEAVVERVAAVRAAIGPENDVALDCHGRCSRTMAKRLLRLLEPYGLRWAEEPVLPEYPEALAELARTSPVPLATGERLYSRWEFKDVVRSGVAVVQPDVAQAGGISETLRIAALADAYDVSVAIHCPLGPIALAASLQVDFAIPNALIQEQGVDYDWALEGLGAAGILDYLVDTSVFRYEDGYAARPTGPGLGIEVDERAVERAAAVGHGAGRSVHRHADGAFAEW